MGRAELEHRVETLPYSWYVDPAVAAAEQEHIFRRSWQYVGHAGDLDGPGSFFPTPAGGLPVIVVLDRQGELRAFFNVCRHRGTILVSEPQKRGTIQCPYVNPRAPVTACRRRSRARRPRRRGRARRVSRPESSFQPC